MKTILTIAFVLCIGIILNQHTIKSQDENNETPVKYDSLNPPIIEVEPASFEVPRPTGRFISKELKVFNKGGSTLVIQNVTTSCYCGMTTILNSKIDSASEGKIMLYINLDGVHGDNNIMTFTINCNAKNSPKKVTITILPPTEPKYPEN
ncbi:MAG: DUF1573 domain-containing protein [FCB group bacterium]|jgi:hypothetical protein